MLAAMDGSNTARTLARPVVHALRRAGQRIGRVLRPPRKWDGRHHPALLRFPPWEGEADGTFCYDFLGVKTDPRFRPQFRPQPRGRLRVDYPPPHAGYFEIAFLLEAVLAPREDRPFTMLEVGAGYGPWLVTAQRACALQGAPTARLIGVEMVPHHCKWMHEHFRNNGIAPEDHRLIHGAISDVEGHAIFRGEQDRRFDFGQTVTRRHAGRVAEADGSPENRVACFPLSGLLKEIGEIDLLHVDIQGEELRALVPALPELSRTVRRLLVATHSGRIHRSLRREFAASGWRKVYDFRVRSRERTEFGDVQFLDGILAVVNSELAGSGPERPDPPDSQQI